MTTNDAARRRILVVDDEPSIRMILRHQLEAEGYDVACCGDGVDALGSIERQPPELVLLDLDMPRFNGFEVCRRIKSDARYRFLPVIILTARNETDARL